MILKVVTALCIVGLIGLGLAVTDPSTLQHSAAPPLTVEHLPVMQYIGGEVFVYPTLQDASIISNHTEEEILRAIQTGEPIDNSHFAFTN